MTTLYTIDLKPLTALVHLTGKGDIRFYLNGVRVEFTHDKTTYVATDGHVLGVVSIPVTGGPSQPQAYIIPRDVVEKLKYGTLNEAQLSVYEDGKKGRIVHPNFEVGFSFIGGVYPDWRRVVPEKTSGDVAQFDVELLVQLMKCNKALGAKWPGRIKLSHNGSSGALVSLVDDRFVGVVMPVRV